MPFFFKKKTEERYVIVEREIESGVFRQGILLNDERFSKIVITVSPKVGLKETEDGFLKMDFSFVVESNPKKICYDPNELRNHIGEILLELIEKDYNKNE